MIEPTSTPAPEPAATITAAQDGDISLDAVPTIAPTGYELESVIGEGGMGVVYRARELTMNRDVAVKLLRSRFSPESAVGRRFVEEARITGQLQHPGIPPVHQVGTLPDGRPFLAMKLIKGRTLDELLKERSDPGVERGRYLAIFEQIAQAGRVCPRPLTVIHSGFEARQHHGWEFWRSASHGLGTGESAGCSTAGTNLQWMIRHSGPEIRSLRDAPLRQRRPVALLRSGTPAFMALLSRRARNRPSGPWIRSPSVPTCSALVPSSLCVILTEASRHSRFRRAPRVLDGWQRVRSSMMHSPVWMPVGPSWN